MDFPSNSSKDKEAKQEKTERPAVERVVKGPVLARKKPLGAKFKEVFIGGESRAAIRYISYEVLLPALRNMVVDATTKGIERVIYGDESPRRSSYGSPRISYSSPSSGRRGGSRYEDPRRGRPSARREIMDLVFQSREEADNVLTVMLDILDRYDKVSVADMNELSGLHSTHVDVKWGWTDLRGVDVRQIREGFIIDFPPPEPI